MDERSNFRQKLAASLQESDISIDTTDFVENYLAGIVAADLEDFLIDDLVQDAISHLQLARERRESEVLLNAVTPRDRSGSPYSLVQIVTDDMPFLVDSVKMEINRHGLSVLLTVHPAFYVQRNNNGQIQSVLCATKAKTKADHKESFLSIRVSHRGAQRDLSTLETDLRQVLRDVALAVRDWPAMKTTMRGLAETTTRLPIAYDDLAETCAFLEWLVKDHFTFLGYRQYDLLEIEGEDVLQVVPDTGLGILSDSAEEISTAFSVLPPHIRKYARLPVPLVMTKANSRSTVHRPGYLDYIGIKRFDEHGNVIGEHRFLGLYTSAAYFRDPRDIPLLRTKVAKVLGRADLDPTSHSGKALLNILQTFPRDELFQIDEEPLYQSVTGILGLEDRQRVRLFVLPDKYGRFVSCLVYVPRDKYDAVLRQRIQALLKNCFRGEQVDFTTKLGEHPMASIYIVVRAPQLGVENINVEQLEDDIAELVQSWHDRLYDALAKRYGDDVAGELFKKYDSAFDVVYREQFNVEIAIRDITNLEALASASAKLELELKTDSTQLSLRIYHVAEPLTLSTVLPILEAFGLHIVGERPFCLAINEELRYWIHEFDARVESSAKFDDSVHARFRDGFIRVWENQLENDRFNALITTAGLDWRHITILRAYCRYLLQVKVPFSEAYMANTLVKNPELASQLVELFICRFDPGLSDRDTRIKEITQNLATDLDAISSLDEDRILRNYIAAIQATVRTNYYQQRKERTVHASFSIKLRPAEIPGIPRPYPAFEIFVYATQVEGVHLRGGQVARGGLRWSDRLEDYRTEILGLLKAQMVKNAVIVPVGAKGGFVVKGNGTTPRREQVVDAYRTFIQGLLDVTDNRIAGRIVPPANTVRHDDDDSYLVVAADKGTAAFSDIANELAVENGFWLGDAFASGGSTGYDHKRMGITARGAWESVRRHFTELEKNIQETPFTVVGIGDMAGDVFGNGMLLSNQIKLLAAFNHRHIFLDPDPDPVNSFIERQRLFTSQNAQWSDYDRALLSKGGDVYERSAKRVELSEQAQAVLAVDQSGMTPGELIQVILRAPVDLLWNGGIGTFVKASFEGHADADDRSNDANRVDARDLRCKVVGEGGNLGFTQQARIEFSKQGGLINTDFIDNSGGVDCSDREVNIKILLGSATGTGVLTVEARNALLAEMTDDVAQLVLRDNYLQTRAISYAIARGRQRLGAYARMLKFLEQIAGLDRVLEKLPDDDALAERLQSGSGLTRPELAVITSYTKLGLYDQLITSDLPDDRDCFDQLEMYFPQALHRCCGEHFNAHPLRREIVATALANRIVHSLDLNFARRVGEQSGCPVPDLARAFLAAVKIFDFDSMQSRVELLDNRVPAAIQTQMMRDLGRTIERGSFWLLRNRPYPLPITETITFFSAGAGKLIHELEQLLSVDERRHYRAELRKLTGAGVPEETARLFARLDAEFTVLDIVEVASRYDQDIELTAKVYYEIGSRFNLPWLRSQISGLPAEHHLQGLAKSGLYTDLYRSQRLLCIKALTHNSLRTPTGRIERWLRAFEHETARSKYLLREARNSENRDLAMMLVIAREIERLATN